MPPRRSAEHEETVARRLAALTASLAAQQQPEEAGRPWPPDSWAEGHTRLRRLDPPAESETVAAWPGTPVGAEGDAGAGHGRAAQGGVAEPGPPEPSVLPRPGRHASRRQVRSAVPLLPSGLRGRVALGTQQVAVVAVLACVGLALTSWWLVRSATPAMVPVATTATPAEEGGTAAPSAEPLLTPAAGATGAPAGDEVVVDVAGRVRRPGIAVLPAGARVADALEAAGGAKAGVDLTTLNLARPLVDGEQVLVGVEPPAGAPAVPGPSGEASADGLVNLNTADQTTLETLPGVGPVTASAILAWRESHGGFTSVDELIEVDGIGEKTLAVLAPLVTV